MNSLLFGKVFKMWKRQSGFISPAGAQGLVKSPFTIITALFSSHILPPPAPQNPPANSRLPDKTSDKSWRTVSLKFASPPSRRSPLKVTPSPPV